MLKTVWHWYVFVYWFDIIDYLWYFILKTVGYLCKNRGIFSFSGIFYESESKKKNIYLKKIKSVFTVSFDQFNLYFFSAVKRLNAINRIQNKRFCLHNICVYTVYIYYVYIYIYIYIYI